MAGEKDLARDPAWPADLFRRDALMSGFALADRRFAAIDRAVCDQQNWSISASATEEEGAQFCIEIPQTLIVGP